MEGTERRSVELCQEAAVGRPTAAFKTGALTFAGSLTLLFVAMGALGVVGS